MIPLIIWTLILFAWLGYETDWYRVRLLAGTLIVNLSESIPYMLWYAEFSKVCGKGWYSQELFQPRSEGNGHYGEQYKHYKIVLSCGIKPMCGQKWLDKHYHDHDNYIPQIEFSMPGYKQSFALRNQTKFKQILAANFKGKRELRLRL